MKQDIMRWGGFIMLCGTLLSAQAQIKIVPAEKVTQGERGYFYYLPRTVFYLDVTVHKSSLRAGEFARFAEKLLGTTASTTNTEEWSIHQITVQSTSESNPQELYHIVPAREGAILPSIAITPQGFIQAINYKGEIKPFTNHLPELPNSKVLEDYATGAEKLLGEEYMLAGSSNKMAEIAARAIFGTREAKQDLLTGMLEQMPKDGEALKFLSAQLDQQEQLLTSLFTGARRTEVIHYRIPIEIKQGTRKEVLFRFSTKLGLLDSDDLGGEPFYANTILKEPAEPKIKVWTEKELREISNPNSEVHKLGLTYNVPSQLTLSFTWKNQDLLNSSYSATQGGYQGHLSINEFQNTSNTSTGILFDPATGAILRRE